MKKIYIAGKITGECETPKLMKECYNKFEKYGCSILIEHNTIAYTGTHPFSHTLDRFVGFTHGLKINFDNLGKLEWKDYMKNDLSVLLTCDECHFLPDWKDSKGAKIEHQLCLDLGIKIVYA